VPPVDTRSDGTEDTLPARSIVRIKTR